MKILSLSEAKMKLSELIDRVNKTSNEIVITKNGQPAAVLVHPDEFESLKETAEILSNQDMLGEIKKGLKALKQKKAKLYTLKELFD